MLRRMQLQSHLLAVPTFTLDSAVKAENEFLHMRREKRREDPNLSMKTVAATM